jgi:altronate dehydratase large subunit
MGFQGYPRPDGSAGVRNYVAVISSVSCANGVVQAIARELPQVKPLTHTEGCGRGLKDIAISSRTLAGLGKNPNVAAALVVGLGCEFIKPQALAEQISSSKKPVEYLVIQDQGGSQKTARKGVEIARRMLTYADSIPRRECGWEQLMLALKCGGSDALSGVPANPMVGRAADWLAEKGGTVILSETTEMIGTEKILAGRAATPEVAARIEAIIMEQEKTAKALLGPLAGLVISPGNIEGGLSSIREKALGCIVKAGSAPIQEVVDYAARPAKRGVVIMDTPGSDIYSLTGMAAAGAQIMVFTTGRGTPAGFPLAPVIKVASNSELFAKMNDDMDLNAGKVLEGMSLEEAGQELIAFLKQVANGEPTKAEINRQDLLSIHTVEPAF